MLDVLLIEDDARIQAALSARLGAAGMSVRQSYNGLDGVRQVKEKTPDVIVLDVRMPGLDGIEVCRQVRMHTSSHNTPVIFLSAETCPQIRAAAINNGGNRFLEKPYEPGDLLAAIADLT
ncbi:MAG: response regulator transcription factor [Phycisphaerales bacterium JB063]